MKIFINYHTLLKALCFALLLVVFISGAYSQIETQPTKSGLQLWDDKPAAQWMTEAYPIGNGRMGAMVFGGVQREHIQFNEQSLWTGDEEETGNYQAFGDLFIDFQSPKNKATKYRRELALDSAIHTVSYEQDGTRFTRSYFCSYPGKAMVMRFDAHGNTKYSALIALKDAHSTLTSGKANTLGFSGKLANNLEYSARLKVITDGGTSKVINRKGEQAKIQITNAGSFTIILTAATNYDANYLHAWRSGSASQRAIISLRKSEGFTYEKLKRQHIADYQNLFTRMQLHLPTNTLIGKEITTRERIIAYKSRPDPALEALLFQFGRYLLISSSRKGGLPANLQGLWNNTNQPPWRSDYHSNINVQMNYWPAEITALTECHYPYLDYIKSIAPVAKRHTQVKYPGVRGWTVRTENNIFGGSGFIWNTPASAWYAQGLWEHYAFTLDKKYLRNHAYPLMKEIVHFWDDHLKRRTDGSLVAPLGWSPEHGPTEDGVSYDQQIVFDLFTNYIAAAGELNVDQDYKLRVISLRENLLAPKIGRWGQLQEWETDRDDQNDHHRHVSHLFGLHPGKQISPTTTPALARAAMVSLLARGDESTGWSMAWKMNFWARLLDGDHAHQIIKNFINLAGKASIDYDNGGGVYANLLCAHPPFQIDGNLGYAAGIAEMLVQSHTGEIFLLPALPMAWKDGSVKGLHARGAFRIEEMIWEAGKVTLLKITALKGGDCHLRVGNPLLTTNGVISAVSGKDYQYQFKAQPGVTYTFKSR